MKEIVIPTGEDATDMVSFVVKEYGTLATGTITGVEFVTTEPSDETSPRKITIKIEMDAAARLVGGMLDD